MNLYYSLIIPVYNRPDEIDELLDSLCKQTYNNPFEVIIVEDGSTITAEKVIKDYGHLLYISYFFKPNSGPGDSRNYGMKQAMGDYYIILDSDCILPENYLQEVDRFLQTGYVDCFGGRDAEHASFTPLQKAISYSMTSFLTTGGIRGSKKAVNKFQPRSFNMGLSKKVFEETQGFGNIHPGEDPDLTLRIWEKGFKTAYIDKAFVYHKRRISWNSFYRQVYKFGLTRPILNRWHPGSEKITFWFPTLFVSGLLGSLLFALAGFPYFALAYILYYFLIFTDCFIKHNNIKIATLALIAVTIQFFGYGYAFFKATVTLGFSKKDPETLFPGVFF